MKNTILVDVSMSKNKAQCYEFKTFFLIVYCSSETMVTNMELNSDGSSHRCTQKQEKGPKQNEINTEMITIRLKLWLTNGLNPNMGFSAQNCKVNKHKVKERNETREVKIDSVDGLSWVVIVCAIDPYLVAVYLCASVASTSNAFRLQYLFKQKHGNINIEAAGC